MLVLMWLFFYKFVLSLLNFSSINIVINVISFHFVIINCVAILTLVLQLFVYNFFAGSVFVLLF